MRSVLFGLAVVALLSTASAQERPPSRDAQAVAPVTTPSTTGLTAPLRRDPFAASDKIRARAEPRGDLAPGFTPAQGGATIPHLTLRGYVEPKGRPAVALLEIEGQGTFVVRAGDTVGITVNGRNTVLRVLAVEAQGARIEAGSFGQVIVIR